jgi:hypothetical protein
LPLIKTVAHEQYLPRVLVLEERESRIDGSAMPWRTSGPPTEAVDPEQDEANSGCPAFLVKEQE